jgi:hypothetical protein
MYYDTNMKENQTTQQSGFIALMATIIISLILAVMAFQESAAGFHARFNILGTEAKEQATALAEGCADHATANLITNPDYLGNSTTTLAAGTCHVFPIALNSPAPGLATVKTQAQVRGSYANLAIVLNMNNLHLGGTPVSPTTGTLVVYTTVYNNNGGTAVPSDFTMNITGGSPSPSSFSGTATGKAVTLAPGGYSVAASAVSGYSSSYSSGCIGTIGAGELKYCVVGEDDVATSLTLLVNVKNDNAGTKTPSDFSLFIDGTPAGNGTRYPISPASHLASTTPVDGYAFSSWGGDCNPDGTITLAPGDNKTCIINFDDNPPPSLSCADSVLMLSSSMTTANNEATIDVEKIAANAFIDQYKQVEADPDYPKLGIGRYLNASGDNESAEIVQTLMDIGTTTDATPLYAAVNTISSENGNINIGTAINTAKDELIAHARPGADKVIVLVGPKNAALQQSDLDAATAAKNAGIKIFVFKYQNGDAYEELASPGGFFTTENLGDMKTIFETMARSVCSAIAAPPPPTPPTTGTLIIHVDIVNDNGGTKAASDFTVHITGGSPSPAGPFTGGTLSSDVNVILNPGAYNTAEDPMTGYNELMGANCTGSIASGETKLCTIINDDIPPPPPPLDFGVTIGEWEEIPVGE